MTQNSLPSGSARMCHVLAARNPDAVRADPRDNAGIMRKKTPWVFVDCEARGTSPVHGVLTEFGAVHYDTRDAFHWRLFDATPDPGNPAVSIVGERIATDSEVAGSRRSDRAAGRAPAGAAASSRAGRTTSRWTALEEQTDRAPRHQRGPQRPGLARLARIARARTDLIRQRETSRAGRGRGACPRAWPVPGRPGSCVPPQRGPQAAPAATAEMRPRDQRRPAAAPRSAR